MDKELIFSYRRKTVHTESFDANHPKAYWFLPSGFNRLVAAWDPI
jgi:hypothetical protein